ncbi:tpr repeat [hydrocarbon metagenome]|uniref:Tpr repeat n=1 Tax=hydrocarbon metagenome TaxID=938273 RepID=A0A0W8G225_9ZZZZ
MSAELSRARAQISAIGTHLKQGKVFPAATALYEAINNILRSQLMKSERDEFARMITDAVYLLNNDKGFRSSYPLLMQYQPGQEKQLAEMLRDVLQELQHSAVTEAKDIIQELQHRREAALERGRLLLVEQKNDEAREVLEKLAREFPEDSDLKARIADLFIKGELYEDAFTYLDEALDLSPDQIHLYNRIGIVLRRLKKFDVAEKYFIRAVPYAKNDANLYFNLGRVYVDWERFDKAEKAARIALRITPSFEEAKKMLNFSLRRQGKPIEP